MVTVLNIFEHLPFENDGSIEGDLAAEFDIEIGDDKASKLILDLVEAGVHYQCTIDSDTGDAVLSATQEGKPLEVFEDSKDDGLRGVATAKGKTSVNSGERHTIKLANVDNTLTLWVDGATVDFSPSNRVISDPLSQMKNHRPKSAKNDPLDAAPVGLGVSGTSAIVHRAQTWRDVYYIASKGNLTDYGEVGGLSRELGRSVSSVDLGSYLQRQFGSEKPDRFSEPISLHRDALFFHSESVERQSAF